LYTIDWRRSIANMLRAVRPWGVGLLAVAGLACVPEIDLAGRPCPCADGYVCDVSVNRCVIGDGPGAGSGGAGPATTGPGSGPVGSGGAISATSAGSGGGSTVGSGGGGSGGGGGCPTLAGPGTFPTPGAQIFDQFNGFNGPLEGNWSGDTSEAIIDEQELWLFPAPDEVAVFWNTPLCPDQEVFATVPWIDNLSQEIQLTLKSQYGGDCDRIAIIYHPDGDLIGVQYCDSNDGWGPHLGEVPFDMSPGDVFGARARQDGSVEVYVNGELIMDHVNEEWPYHGQGGLVGVAQWEPDEGQYWDDFGGY
jgi:hypothetical protein